jgi:hypothetical protein
VVPQRDWVEWVNCAETAAELDMLRTSVKRGQPFRNARWKTRMASQLKLGQTLRDPGRPKKSVKAKN